MIKIIQNKHLIEYHYPKLILEYMLEQKKIRCYCIKNDKICIDYYSDVNIIEEMKNTAYIILKKTQANQYRLFLEVIGYET